ncbi:NAD(P)H-dependent oxidoreductase subunit E [Archaeoglobales archaeon]|nr:MAG: NAD(P)H-dependent oxidoreductase subunit E [Archaeoglobales archaeon]
MKYLLNSLLEIQSKHGYLPKEELEKISVEFNVPMSRIYSIATFYNAFSLKPVGKHIIHVCKGTACVMGGSEVFEDTLKQLRIFDYEDFTYQPIRCFGACSLAPVVVIDGKVYGKMTVSRLKKMLSKLRDEDAREA